MNERRRRRSERTDEALLFLLEALRDRSEVSSVAIVDDRGFLVAGTGPERELEILGAVAGPAATGQLDALCESLIEDTDVLACPIAVGDDRFFLAALGERASRMTDAVRGAERILRAP